MTDHYVTFAALPPGEEAEPSPPFVLLRAGEFEKGGRRIELTEADLARAVENFEEDRGRGVQLALDYDHSFVEGRGSLASGWYRSLVKRGRELLAQVTWTPVAREQIARGEYRYVSAEFDRDHATEDGTRRGFAVVSGGLTNRPFLRDLEPVTLSVSRADELERLVSEHETRVASGAFNLAAERHEIRTLRLANERGIPYTEAAAAAWKEMR